MTISNNPLLSPEQRSRLAAMPELGGGNLLATAMAVHPDPHIPFIRTDRPVMNTAGEEQTEFTLAQIDALAQSWSVWYHNQGVGPRDRVALYIADTFAYTIHLNALAQLGAIPVLINSKASPALALGLCERTTPVGIYTDRTRLAAISEGIGSLDGLRWVQLAEDLPAPPPAALPDAWRFRHAPEDPVSIMHSSGTTGVPKAVTQTHASSVAGPRYRSRISGASFTPPTPSSPAHRSCRSTTRAVRNWRPPCASTNRSRSWHSPTPMPSWPRSTRRKAPSIRSTTGSPWATPSTRPTSGRSWPSATRTARPPPSMTASARPSSAGVWWCSHGRCRRSARIGGSARPIPSPRSRRCGRTAAGRRWARWVSSGPGARPSPPGTGTTPTPPIARSWAATG